MIIANEAKGKKKKFHRPWQGHVNMPAILQPEANNNVSLRS